MVTMVPTALPIAHDTGEVRVDGRPTPALREELRRIASWRNAGSVVALYAQTAFLVWLTVRYVWTLPITFVLMGRAFAQFASLMHEAAHRLLFADKRINDWVGRWLLGYPAFTSTDAYRRVHMAHHRDEFGPEEPDIALYAGYPIGPTSFRRKIVRDATGQTGFKLMRQLLGNVRSADSRSRRTVWKILAIQAVLLGAAIVSGHWWLYPVLWLGPYLTVWRVINRLRSIAEHGGMERSKDRRQTTHSVRQHALARFILVPYNIGWHLAHHVDSGVPFRNLPRFHRALHEAGYVDDTIEYASYPAIWRALKS
ncbi:MAG TPA: fatty acid desaturase [Ilumatobacteraceae bacterium]|jgi:fatty acid desaturase